MEEPIEQDTLKELERVYQEAERTLPALAIEKFELGLTLATAYRQMGMAEKAIPLYRQLAQIIESRETTPSHERVLILHELALCMQVAGLYRDATVVIGEYRNLLKEFFPDRHEEIYTSLNNLATAYMGMEDYAEAEQAYQDLLEYARTQAGGKPESIAATYHNLGMLYFKTDRPAEAEAAWNQALRLKRSLFGDNHAQVGMTLHCIAMLYKDSDPERHQNLLADAIAKMGYDPNATRQSPLSQAGHRQATAKAPADNYVAVRCIALDAAAQQILAEFFHSMRVVGMVFHNAVRSVQTAEIYEEGVLPPIVTFYGSAAVFQNCQSAMSQMHRALATLLQQFKKARRNGYETSSGFTTTNDVGFFVQFGDKTVRYYIRPDQLCREALVTLPKTFRSPTLAKCLNLPERPFGRVAFWNPAPRCWEYLDLDGNNSPTYPLEAVNTPWTEQLLEFGVELIQTLARLVITLVGGILLLGVLYLLIRLLR